MVGQTPHCRGTGEIIICGGRQEPRISYKGIIANLSRAIFNWPFAEVEGNLERGDKRKTKCEKRELEKDESEGHYF